MPDDQEILQLRPQKQKLDPTRPYHFLHEQETDAAGTIREVNTIFLTNRECPFRCLMCDLWKHTLDEPTPAGAIVEQIEYALDRLPEASVIKLYNNGNFFDSKAIPPGDYQAIAGLLSDYEQVIVENHPKLCGQRCLEFQSLIDGNLEIAMGLETIHPEILPKLNKQITTENFREAAAFLKENDIRLRAFILLNLPFLTDTEENIFWTVKSVAFAFECGAGACAIIPTRPGNGIMDRLMKKGQFKPPTLDALEKAFRQSLGLQGGRVFADLWDLQQFSDCDRCFDERKSRLKRMNLKQTILPENSCDFH
jgi:radical SAM enzyme (TIGR01210 family)